MFHHSGDAVNSFDPALTFCLSGLTEQSAIFSDRNEGHAVLIQISIVSGEKTSVF